MYKEKLLEFMREKNKIIKRYTGLLLTKKTDMEELQTWSEGMCKRVLYSLSIGIDGRICPWCLVHDRSCVNCGYGERNGVCLNEARWGCTDRYHQIRSRLRVKIGKASAQITDIPEIQVLVKRYRADVRDL